MRPSSVSCFTTLALPSISMSLPASDLGATNQLWIDLTLQLRVGSRPPGWRNVVCADLHNGARLLQMRRRQQPGWITGTLRLLPGVRCDRWLRGEDSSFVMDGPVATASTSRDKETTIGPTAS